MDHGLWILDCELSILDRGLWIIVCRSLKCFNGLDHNLVILFTAVVLCVIVVDHGLLVVDYGSWIMDRVSWIIVSMSSIGILKYILSAVWKVASKVMQANAGKGGGREAYTAQAIMEITAWRKFRSCRQFAIFAMFIPTV